MNKEMLLEVVAELIGYSEPCGDSFIDEVRYENQEKIIDLVLNGIEDLIHNAGYRNNKEYNVHKIGNRAYDVLEDIRNMIENYQLNK